MFSGRVCLEVEVVDKGEHECLLSVDGLLTPAAEEERILPLSG